MCWQAERAEKLAELEALKSASRASAVKKKVESGKLGEEKEEEKAPREKLTAIGQEKYDKFKDKFEHLEDTLEKQNAEKAKTLQTEVIHGPGKEALSKNKDRFEKGLEELLEEGGEELGGPKDPIKIERSAAEKRRVHKTFNQVASLLLLPLLRNLLRHEHEMGRR